MISLHYFCKTWIESRFLLSDPEWCATVLCTLCSSLNYSLMSILHLFSIESSLTEIFSIISCVRFSKALCISRVFCSNYSWFTNRWCISVSRESIFFSLNAISFTCYSRPLNAEQRSRVSLSIFFWVFVILSSRPGSPYISSSSVLTLASALWSWFFISVMISISRRLDYA